MSENFGKRVAWGIIAVGVMTAIAAGAFWFHSRRPKPERKPQLAVVGVGLYLGRNQQTRQFEIRKVFPNSPAEKAGVVPGLVLSKVDDVYVEPKNIKQVSALLTGPVGSKVTLELVDTNGATTDVEIERERFLNRSTAPP